MYVAVSDIDAISTLYHNVSLEANAFLAVIVWRWKQRGGCSGTPKVQTHICDIIINYWCIYIITLNVNVKCYVLIPGNLIEVHLRGAFRCK